MRILVTGGAGFIGANLCRELVSHKGIEVTVLDDMSTGKFKNVDGLAVDVVEGSVLDPDLLDSLMLGAHAVVHLAAKASVPESMAHPTMYNEINVVGTINVLEACRAEKTPIVIASSSSVYGDNTMTPVREDVVPRPQTPYAASKLAAEAYAAAYARSYGIPVLVFRFFNVYGPLQAADHPYAAVVPALISATLSGQPMRIYGDGGQTRDFTYVGSVAKILARAAIDRVQSRSPVNLAAGTKTAVIDLARHLNNWRSSTIENLPPRVGDIRHSHAEISALASLFPDHDDIPLDVGLAQTLEWFEQQLEWTSSGRR